MICNWRQVYPFQEAGNAVCTGLKITTPVPIKVSWPTFCLWGEGAGTATILG